MKMMNKFCALMLSVALCAGMAAQRVAGGLCLLLRGLLFLRLCL